MAKFRKKPIVIEAEQFWPGKMPWPEGVERGKPKPHGRLSKRTGGYWIATFEGWFEVKAGDWIIIGVMGEKYPCKDEIFRMTYEPVDADGSGFGGS